MAQDSIKRGQLAAPDTSAFNPNSSIVVEGTHRRSGLADTGMSWMKGIEAWYAQNQQWAVQEGYMDAINGTVQEVSWYKREGYNQGTKQYDYEQLRLGAVNETARLNREAAEGRLTEEEREAGVRAAYKELTEFATSELRGEARAVAEGDVLKSYALTAKNYQEELERSAIMKSNDAMIMGVASTVDTLVTAQNPDTFNAIFSGEMQRLSKSVADAKLATPDGYKTYRVDESKAKAAAIEQMARTLNLTSPEGVAKLNTMVAYAANDPMFDVDVRDALFKRLDIHQDEVRSSNMFAMGVTLHNWEMAMESGNFDEIDAGELEGMAQATIQAVQMQTITPQQGTAQLNRIGTLHTRLHERRAAFEKANAPTEAQQEAMLISAAMEGATVTDAALRTGIPPDKVSRIYAEGREMWHLQQNPNNRFAAGMNMIQDGVITESMDLQERGGKRLNGWFSGMFNTTDLSTIDKRVSDSLPQWAAAYVNAERGGKHQTMALLESMFPEQYREAVRDVVRNQPQTMNDARNAVPALVNAAQRIEQLKANPALQNLTLTADDFDSVAMGRTPNTGARLGYAGNASVRALQAQNVMSHYRDKRYVLKGRGYDKASIVDVMLREGEVLSLKSGVIPSSPQAQQHFLSLTKQSGSQAATFGDTVWKFMEETAKLNNVSVDNVTASVVNDALHIYTIKEDGQAVGHTRVLTIDHLANDFNKSVQPVKTTPSNYAQQQRAQWEAQMAKATTNIPKAPRTTNVVKNLPQQPKQSAPKQAAPKQPAAQRAQQTQALGMNTARPKANGRDGRIQILQQELANEKKALAAARLQAKNLDMTHGNGQGLQNSRAAVKRALADREQNVRALEAELSRM